MACFIVACETRSTLPRQSTADIARLIIKIQKRDAPVAELLLLLAYFNNRDIQYELVKYIEYSPQSRIWFNDVVLDALTFKDNIQTLS
jgi:hypothetical protein